MFNIKNKNYFKLLTYEMMKLFEKTKNKITKDKNRENITHLEMTEIASVHCNIVKK